MNVSSIIPTFNRSKVLARAIESALSQLRPSDELIVVDDGSTDGTPDLLRSYTDSRLRYIQQPNGGAGAARNRGAAEARGELLAFLDSDDEWLPGKLELQRRLMESRPDVLFCFTDFIREYGGRQHRRSISSWHTDTRSWQEIIGVPIDYSTITGEPKSDGDFAVFIGDIYLGEMFTNYILTSSLMVRKSAGDAIHFTVGVRTFEDWECFGRLAARGNAAYLDIETAIQYGHEGPRLTDADLFTCSEARLVVLQNVWGSDRAFLASHGQKYAELVRQVKIDRIRGLLSLGRTQEARKAIAFADKVPLGYRLIAGLPSELTRRLLALRRAVRDRVSTPKSKLSLEAH